MFTQKQWDAIPRDDIFLFNTGNAQKAWMAFGCHYLPELNCHRFMVWAPNALSISVLGDFNDWNSSACYMEKIEGGVWVAFVEGVFHSQRYKYCVEGPDGRRVMKTDPFALWCQYGAETASMVYNGSDYVWNDANFMAERAKRNFMTRPMSIYEVHLGSWKDFKFGFLNYRELGDQLAEYCVDMGFTHVEIMPVTEYPFDGSWGYQVTGYFAPTSRYGTPDDFRYMVDKLHSVGVGVIMDWVPGHFPKDEHGLAMFDGTPQFECKERRMAEHPEWGTLVFDYASQQVQSFLVSSACCFMELYHIDGLRVDAVSSMLYLNYCRQPGEFTPNRHGGVINLEAVDFLRKMNSTVLSNYPGAITIAEEATAYPKITAPPHDGGLGFCFKWDMGFMHDTLDYMKLDPYFRSQHHNMLTFSMMYAFSENYVLAYSHDEVVHGKLSMINKMSGLYGQKFDSLRTLYGFQFGHPGKKLCFMGSEFAQFIEWNWKQGLDWLLLDYPQHRMMREYYKALNKLYTSSPALYEIDNSWDGFKWLNVNDRDRSSVAFMRSGNDSHMICACNFTPVKYENFVIGLPEKGTLREVLSSDEQRFGGNGIRNRELITSEDEGFLEFSYSAKIDLPPMSAVFFEYKMNKTEEKDEKGIS